jgi:phage shock protein C
MDKMLYKSQRNRVFGGICGGLGEYFGIDPTLIRIMTVVFGIITAFFPLLVVYIIGVIIIPEEYTVNNQTNNTGYSNVNNNNSNTGNYNAQTGQAGNGNQYNHPEPKKSNSNSIKYIGIVLIGIGILAILNELFSTTFSVAIVLLFVGGYFIYNAYKESNKEE